MVNISKLSLSTILLAASLAAGAQTAPEASILAKANELFHAQDWERSAEAFKTVSVADPRNARVWYRLGISLHKLGLYEQGIAAQKRALNLMPEPNKSLAMYDIGSSYAKLSDKDHAFEWLNKAIDAGYPSSVPLASDPDLSILREDDTRFQGLVELAINVQSQVSIVWNTSNSTFGSANGTCRTRRVNPSARAASSGSRMAASSWKTGSMFKAERARALTFTMQSCVNGDKRGRTMSAASANFRADTRTERSATRANRTRRTAPKYCGV